MQIKSLESIPVEQVHQAFVSAFADYSEPVSLSISQFRYLLERRSYEARLSFGAFQNGELTGFILNGLGDWDGVRTAYDTGTGVIKAFRKHGVATLLLGACLPALIENGVRQYLLEVIKTNTKAVALYRKTGFVVTREFDYWVGEIPSNRSWQALIPDGFSINEIRSPDWELLGRFWDFRPSWQNSAAAVARKREHFLLLGAHRAGEVVGYACMERHTGDVPQFAVHPDFRRRGLASALMARLLAEARPPELRIINTDTGSVATRHFLRGIGLDPGDGQYEMALEL